MPTKQTASRPIPNYKNAYGDFGADTFRVLFAIDKPTIKKQIT